VGRYKLLCYHGPGLQNPWVYGFGYYIPRPMPINPLGLAFYPLTNTWIEKLTQTHKNPSGFRYPLPSLVASDKCSCASITMWLRLYLYTLMLAAQNRGSHRLMKFRASWVYPYPYKTRCFTMLRTLCVLFPFKLSGDVICMSFPHSSFQRSPYLLWMCIS